eukprot:6012235-Alexandrium_andersonii.AAC.1
MQTARALLEPVGPAVACRLEGRGQAEPLAPTAPACAARRRFCRCRARLAVGAQVRQPAACGAGRRMPLARPAGAANWQDGRA